MLNSVFLERITEIMSSSNIGEDVHPYNFLITKASENNVKTFFQFDNQSIIRSSLLMMELQFMSIGMQTITFLL